MLSEHKNPILTRGLTAAGIENELRALPHLTQDLAETVAQTKRRCKDARKCASALDAIKRLPARNEALHMVVSGRFALWHVVPAVSKLCGCRIEQLRIATLGFSRQNIDELLAMLDAAAPSHPSAPTPSCW
jgi:hypothetical protein